MIQSLSTPDYVELDRRFVPFDQAGSPDTDELWAEILASKEEKRDWTWLLSHRIVALLAEAGSGKSYEFRSQVDRLSNQGRFAFYFRIERLCDGQIEKAFETAAQESAFKAWLNSSQEAVFFLDSVDEAKLPRGVKSEPLRDALNTLERAIGSSLGRSRIVVSCRGSEWYGETEQVHLDALVTRMGAAASGGTASSGGASILRNLSFAALDKDRVKLLASAQGDPEDFVGALDDHQLWDEVRTPMDVVHFATTYFNSSDAAEQANKLSSRSAVFDTSVRRRLADRGDSRSRIEVLPNTALVAVRFLAFAITVLQVRDLSFDAPVSGAVDVRSLLECGPVSITPIQMRQILATPLFTPAGRGTVRFYRPEIEPFLAAQYLESLSGNVPAGALTTVFGSQSFGISFVAQQYGPMLAWLAALDQRILRWMTRIAPEFLIEEGDPRALAIGDRIAALEKHVGITHRNLPGSFYFPNAALLRFAEPDLENSVVALLSAKPSREAMLHLLQIARMGKFKAAADWLEQVCGDGFTPPDVRTYAVRALVACGTDDHLRRVCETMLVWGAPLNVAGGHDHVSHREDDARIHLIAAAYPSAISIKTMLRLLKQVRGREFARDAEIFVALAKRAPLADLPRLIDGLERLCWKTRPTVHFSHKAPEQTSRANLLFDGLCAAITRCVEELPDSVRTESIDWCYTSSRYSRLDRDHEEWGRMSEALLVSAPVRQRLIAAAVNSAEAAHPLIGLQAMLQGAWKGSPDAQSSDIAFALREYASSTAENRKAWTDLLMRWMDPMPGVRHRKLSFQLAIAATRHRAGPDWSTLSVSRWRPFGWVARRWFRYTHNDWWHIKFKLRSLYREARGSLTWHWELLRNWRRLNRGETPFIAIHYIFGDRDENISRSELLARKGRLLGNLLINSACRWAAQILADISYRHEIRALNSAGFRWLHEQDAEFSRHLSETVCLAAIQQDLWDSDASPPWAEAMANTDPQFWVSSAETVVIRELNARARFEPDHSNAPLWKSKSLPEARQAQLAPVLLTWAEGHTTMCHADIRPLAEIVLSLPNLKDRLTSLARRGTLEAFHEGQWRRGLAWLEVWARYDVAAIECFSDWLERVWIGNSACESFALTALGNLLGGRWNREEAILVELPARLRLRLANLVHGIVGLADDETSREGIQNVTPRRQMEDVRRLVENYLDADHTAAGREALVAFVGARIEPGYPEWAERWLASHARAANQPTAWSVEKLSQFARSGTSAPTTGDSLLSRVTEEIGAICSTMNVSEFDRRALFNKDTDESDFRAWLGHELDPRLRGWASITQETVTRGEKRTDLRIELKGGDHAVLVIEIKLAHRWNRDVLLDKVKSQLVDQYLIGDRRIRHGIYLLVDFNLPLKGSLTDGTKPDLPALTDLLSSRALQLCDEDGRVVQAQLFGVMR